VGTKSGHHNNSLHKCQKKAARGSARYGMRLIVAPVDAASRNAPVMLKGDPK
jgi:hypothetical protein